MKLPFVSRDTYTMDMAAKQVEIVRAEIRHDLLLAQFVELAREVTRKAIPEPAKLATRTKDDVIEAILQRSGGNGQLRAHLSHWAMEQRKAGVPDDQIIPNILVWHSPDEEEPLT